MNVFGIVLGIVVTAAAAFAAGEFLIARTQARKETAAQEAQREADLRAATARAVEEERERWRRNPLDALRADHTVWGPRFNTNSQKVSDAEHLEEKAKDQMEEYLADFPQKALPHRGRIISIAMLVVAWAVAFVVQAVLDFEIFQALWGNWFFAVLSAMVTSVALAAASVGLAYARARAKSGEVPPRASRAALAGISALFIVILTLLVLWAPQRAFIEFGGRIREAQQQVAVLSGDGDAAAAAVVQADLDVLNKQQQQASDLSQALILIAVLCEFGCGLVVPQGIEIYMALRSRRRQEAAANEVRVAKAVQRHDGVLFSQHASQSLVTAGLTQHELDRFQTALPGVAARPALTGPVTPAPGQPTPVAAAEAPNAETERHPNPRRAPAVPAPGVGGPAPDPALNESELALFDQS